MIAKCAWLVLLTVPLGCGGGNAGSPTPGPPPPSPPTDAGSGSDAGPPTDAVIGSQNELCMTSLGGSAFPTDFSQVVVQAWLPDPTAATGFRTQVGVGKADGTFEIDGVPAGVTYLLQIDTNFFVTDQHSINANFVDDFRCAPQFPHALPPVTLGLTGMSPFATGDTILAASYANTSAQHITPDLAPGTTSLDTTFNWGAALPSAALGDDVTILHTHADDQTDAQTGLTRHVERIVDAFITHDVTLTEGTPATVNGAFTPATAATLPIALDLAPYIAAYQADAEVNAIDFSLSAGPFGAAFVFDANLGELSISGPGLASLSLHDSVPYADPFPASWQRAVLAMPDLVRWYRVSDTNQSGFGIGGLQQVAYTGAAAPTFAAPIPSPAPLLVNGGDVRDGRALSFDGTAPLQLSWQAAAGATLYSVEFWQLDLGMNTGGLNFVAAFTTADTSVVVPASLFTNNQFYAITLSAFDQTPGYASGQLFATFTTFREATIATGRLRFSSTCGNGTIDPGEDCDDKGESAHCNRDCTLAMCGDGILNTTAGEACDTVRDSPTCDAQTCALVTAATALPRAVRPAGQRQRVQPTTHTPRHTRAWQATRSAR